MRNFVVYAPHYNEMAGGIIALHKLCDLINRLGGTAFLHPFHHFGVREEFISPVRWMGDDDSYGDNWIVVYPEVIGGNPLKARNVVRWLLHDPGFHTGSIDYGSNELHIRFANYFDEFHWPECTLSDNLLTVVDYNFALFNDDDAAEERRGSAYCVRKGVGKPIQHDLTDSILIDDMSHAEVASVFKRVSVFYSYDTRTAYSKMAVLCGCDSVVIPDDGVTEARWATTEQAALGVAYGVENIEKARATAHLVKPYCEQLENDSARSVAEFMNEADSFFG